MRIRLKIVIAPDSFKESMTAYEVAVAMEKGVRKVHPNAIVQKIPIADGGEGTVQALLDARGGEKVLVEITGPLGAPVQSYYGVINEDTAVIEVAAACGLDLIPQERRNPMETTSYGVGELMIHALDRGIRRFMIGLGGSGTNDGGIGMAQALGVAITDVAGEPVCYGGNGLTDVAHISLEELDARLADCIVEVASDVTNPLTGASGATAIYGPQKGADEAMVGRLDKAMRAYAEVLQHNIGMNVSEMAGAGAAGGIGAACLAFLHATIQPGIRLIATLTNIESAIQNASLVLTGEGKLDTQTNFGKAITGVAKIARCYDVPVVAITGADHTTTDAMYDLGVTAIFTLPDKPMDITDALESGAILTEKVAENVMRLWIRTYENK